jgi:hypothetical protein
MRLSVLVRFDELRALTNENEDGTRNLPSEIQIAETVAIVLLQTAHAQHILVLLRDTKADSRRELFGRNDGALDILLLPYVRKVNPVGLLARQRDRAKAMLR